MSELSFIKEYASKKEGGVLSFVFSDLNSDQIAKEYEVEDLFSFDKSYNLEDIIKEACNNYYVCNYDIHHGLENYFNCKIPVYHYEFADVEDLLIYHDIDHDIWKIAIVVSRKEVTIDMVQSQVDQYLSCKRASIILSTGWEILDARDIFYSNKYRVYLRFLNGSVTESKLYSGKIPSEDFKKEFEKALAYYNAHRTEKAIK